MGSFPGAMKEYKLQLKKGQIQFAYRGLMDYFRHLSSHFRSAYPEFSVSGSIYYGYMDMTYFSLFPEFLKRRKLKIAIVFVHEAFRFEVWLSGSNRKVQAEYWQLIKDRDWRRFRSASDPKREDFVLDHILIEDPDFEDLDALTAEIENGTLEFINQVEGFFSTTAS